MEKRTGLGEIIYFLCRQTILDILNSKKKKNIKLPSLVYGENNEIKFLYGKQARKLKEKIVKITLADKGGITCHAAIVSREFNIPCIIGAKIATQFLKDSDEIKIDTNKGIVRKIST